MWSCTSHTADSLESSNANTHAQPSGSRWHCAIDSFWRAFMGATAIADVKWAAPWSPSGFRERSQAINVGGS